MCTKVVEFVGIGTPARAFLCVEVISRISWLPSTDEHENGALCACQDGALPLTVPIELDLCGFLRMGCHDTVNDHLYLVDLQCAS